MDLNEAEKSFDYYANLLKMQCALLSRASEMEVTAASTEMAPRASEASNKVLADLEESRRNSLVLSLVVQEEMDKEVPPCVIELAKVMAAANRLAQVSQQADLLIAEQKKKQAQKTEPQQPSAMARTIRELRQKYDRNGSRKVVTRTWRQCAWQDSRCARLDLQAGHRRYA